ncbi:hypothetical protein BGX31_005300 [Mortierella sp. GBA43]|nr:hypothetical protein BGX31_005300 [Mortierella sp. GBA43]
MAKSCQWSGALKDMEQHLDVCGFAVELWCPHHQLGCNYRGAALDIAAHLACCPFSPHEPSVVSESLDDLHVNESVSLRREPPSPPQSSPPIGTQGLHRHQGEAHSQDLIHHDADMDDQYAEAFRTPDLSNIPDDVFDVPEINDQPQKTDKADTSFDQEEFSELLGDLEMTDTTCPTHTALPDRIESSDPANNGLVPLSGALGPRRRLIVDEEESNNGEGDTPNGHQHDRAVEQQHQAEDVNVQPMDVLTKEQEDTAINGEVLGKKRRVLADITTPMTQYGLGDPSSIADTGSMVMSQEAPPANVKDGQICDPGQSTPPVRVQQQEALDQQGSSPRRSSQQKPVRPRELQFHGPWQWQVYRKAKTQSQAPTVITMSDITSPVPTDGAPQSPRAPIVGPAAQTEFVKLFELTQSSAFYAAETCAYLPLHVHEPRYLRSRRKKTLKGQSRARHMTPIVHPVNHHQPFLALGYGNTVTPDITSPENSIVSQSHSVRSTSL